MSEHSVPMLTKERGMEIRPKEFRQNEKGQLYPLVWLRDGKVRRIVKNGKGKLLVKWGGKSQVKKTHETDKTFAIPLQQRTGGILLGDDRRVDEGF